MADNKKIAIKHELWRRGELSWKMHSGQTEMYKIYKNAKPNSTLVWLISRRFGKSYMLTVIALEQAIQNKNNIIKIVTDTKLHAKSIFNPIFRDVLVDCPEDIKPEYIVSEYKYVFPNGSEIQLAGSDGGHYQRLRGQQSDLVLIDEAGFCSNLNDIVWSVLFPTLLHTGGKMVLASTPSAEADHEFNSFIEKADSEGHLIKKTIYENPLLTPEQIQVVVNEMKGVTNPKFRREYLCEQVRDEITTVFPEFTDDLMARIVKEHPKPPFYDCYVGMDLGYKDLTAVIFMYYDMRANVVVVEDEIVVEGTKLLLPKLAEDILKKEAELWTDPINGERIKPLARASDINYIVTQEMSRSTGYKLTFVPAKKDNKVAAINQLRVLMSEERLIIHPRCVNLIRHLKNCKWQNASSKTDFARSPDNGHYDAADGLLYSLREVNFNRNPYPKSFGVSSATLSQANWPQGTPDPYKREQPVDVYKRIFGRKLNVR